MDKVKKISKEPAGTKLFLKDSEHIKKLVKKYRYTDKRFESSSAAIRYYVELGIAAENPVENSAEDLKHKIVLSSQKNIVDEQLVPLTEAIEILFERMKIFDKNQTDYFTDSATHLNRIEAHLERGIKDISRQLLVTSLESIYAQFDGSGKIGEETLRNLIVLRTVFYVFLLGHKTGKTESVKENIVKWSRMINLAHEKANELSMNEVKMLSSEVLEGAIIQNMAREIFRQVNALPAAKTE